MVELFVVTGCLAVLASLAAPATARAREIAIRTQCASNLKQSVRAMQSYSMGNDGWVQLFSDGYYSWWKTPGMPEELGLDTTANINLLDNRKVTYCPVGSNNPDAWITNVCYGTPHPLGDTANDFNSVAIVEYVAWTPHWDRVRINLLPDASRYVILADSAYGPQFASGYVHQKAGDQCPIFYRRNSNFSLICQRHLGEANVGYADGHVGDTADRLGMWNHSKIGSLVDNTGLTATNFSN